MDTSAIRYRVVDFLRKHPPFQAIEEADLLALAGRGRVRFYEPSEYLAWQGEPHKLDVSVIQQGTVSLWDEADGQTSLRDVRGAGDLLGIEQFTGAPRVIHSARSESDVVVYAFPASEFAELVMAAPTARQFVEAYESPTADYQWVQDARDPRRLFVADLIDGRLAETGDPAMTIREAAARILAAGTEALAIVGASERVEGVVTQQALIAWLAGGGGDAGQPVMSIASAPTTALRPDASATDAVLALAESGADGVPMTSDGTVAGSLRALVTAPQLARAFGDRPVGILREIGLAQDVGILRQLNQRTRALALQYLTNADSVDWIARFVSLADAAIVRRVIALTGGDAFDACWCLCGASGRGESMTRQAPALIVLADGTSEQGDLLDAYQRCVEVLDGCGYMAGDGPQLDAAFSVADLAEWSHRFSEWLRDPVRTQMYQARPLFDLRPVYGPVEPYHDIDATIMATVDKDLLRVLANDCLASLPPLTFFQDAVVQESGEQTAVFRLEHSALQPLVDVGRVFGLAARGSLGLSTADRFERARTLLPEQAEIFRDATDTLRTLLWQQARIGIAQGTSGAELPPALLSRHDRHALKGGFRSILRLIEFTADSPWIETL